VLHLLVEFKIPILFIVAGLGIVINTFIADTKNAVIGAVIIAVGVPVFFLWKKK
jgi:hypothetical protein